MQPFPPFNKVAETRHGPLIYNTNDIYVGRSIEMYGEFSHGEAMMFEQIVQPGNVVLEIGANIGAHTVFLAQKVGPTGRVFAFEPQRIIFQTLCGNMAINSVTNVDARHVAVGAEPGQIFVPPLNYAAQHNFGGVELGKFTRGEGVSVITIDSLGLARCNFIKIDVEGMEEQVLRGAVSTIQRYNPILYVECDRKEKETSLLQFIDSIGYDQYWHLTRLFNPNNFHGQPENVFGNIVSKNVLSVSRAVPSQITGLQRVDVPK